MATPRYGDILERNGQLVEFTPVGYMPVSPTRNIANSGMLTMPSDTITPSPTGDVIVKPAPIIKEPAPAPAPAPTPVIQPGEIVQPVVKQSPIVAGQTDPFDPAGGPVGTISTVPTAPSPAVTPVGPVENVQAPLEVMETPSVVETLFSEYFPSQTQATVQTAPIGTPSTPPKQMPGESGPFDPNAVPPVPTTTPTPETELAPPKPLQDTKDVAPVAAPTTFTFFQGSELGDANPSALYNRADATQSSVEDLQEYFNSDSSGMLRQAFGDFDNYLAYMTEREQLIQSGNYDVGNWAEQGVTETGLTEDQMMLFEGDADLTVDPSDPTQNIQNIERSVNTSRQNAYDRWANSEANQALLEKYGVGTTVYNSDGDTFRFNGSSYVKTDKVDDSINAGDVIKMAMMTMATAGLGNAIGGAMGISGSAAGGATLSGAAGSAASNMLSTALVQGAVTGSVDPRSLVSAGLAGGLEYLGNAFKAGNIAAGSDLGASLDNAVWEMADQLGTDYDTVFDMAMGVASGAIQGQDLEEIALGALQTYTTAEVQDFVRTNYADSMGQFQVDNLFDEGETTVPIRAFDSLIETAVGAAFGEEVNAEDITRDFLDFATYDDPDSVDSDVSFSFLDPGLDLPDFGIDTSLLNEFETPEEIKAIEDTVRAAGSEVEDITRAVGSFIDNEIIQPIRDAFPDQTPEEIKAIEDVIRDAGSTLEDVVRAAGSEAEDITRDVGSFIDEEIIQRIREILPEINLPEGPDIDLPEGPDIDLPSINLPSLSFPSISIGSLGGAGGVAKEYQRTDPGGITYDPTLPELYLIQPNRSGMLV
jgi:hypothetical protein